MRRLAECFVALICCALPRPAAAEVVTLASLEQLALQRHPALAAGAAHVRGARAGIDKAESAYYPTLSFGASGALAPGGSFATIEDIHGDQFLVNSPRQEGAGLLNSFIPQVRTDVALELKTSVYDFGRASAMVEASRALHDAAQAEQDVQRHSVVRAVRAAYLAWLGANELLAVAREAQSDAQERRARMSELIAEGVQPQSELSLARADEVLSRLELERADADLRGARLGLEAAVGSRLSGTAEPDRSLLELVPKPDSANPELRAFQLQRDAASRQARAERKADAPQLAAGIKAGFRSQDAEPFPAYNLGISFSLPILDGGATRASVDAALARADEAGALLRDHQEQRRAQLERAKLDAETAATRLATAGELLEIAEQRMHEVEQRYELGASGVDALSQARTLLRRARTEMVLARLARAETALK
jgi:outer membrane protein TolC